MNSIIWEPCDEQHIVHTCKVLAEAVLGVSTLRLVNFGKTHMYCSEHRVQNSTFCTSAELIMAIDFGLLLNY